MKTATMKQSAYLLAGLSVVLLLGVGPAHAQDAPLGGPRSADGRGDRPRGGSGKLGKQQGRFFLDHMSEDERGRVREFVETNFPEQAKQLSRWEQSNPERFRRRFRQMMPRLSHLMEEMENDPEIGKLGIEEIQIEFDIRRTAQKFLEAESAEDGQALRKQMTRLVSKQFDIRQERSKLQIAQLEKRLDRLEDRLAYQLEKRDRIIEHEVDERLHPGDGGMGKHSQDVFLNRTGGPPRTGHQEGKPGPPQRRRSGRGEGN